MWHLFVVGWNVDIVISWTVGMVTLSMEWMKVNFKYILSFDRFTQLVFMEGRCTLRRLGNADG